MAEFENGYCTGCGYKVRRWGHRPYCWRVVCHQLAHVDPTIRTVVMRCLKKMAKHHRLISLFLCRKKHMYYTVKSIEAAPDRESEAARLASRAPDILRSLAKNDPKHQKPVGEYRIEGGRYVFDTADHDGQGSDATD